MSGMSKILSILNRAAWTISFIAIAVLVVIVRDYVGARAEISSLHETVASGQKSVDAATKRESVRDAALRKQIQKIEALKQKVQTPAQVVAALPAALPQLALPITVSRSLALGDEQNGRTPRSGALASGSASITNSAGGKAHSDTSATVLTVPDVDLKSLFDNLENCREATATVATLRQDLNDTKGQLSAVTAERDIVLRKASPNGRWGNVKRATKWLAVGVGLGLALSRRI